MHSYGMRTAAAAIAAVLLATAAFPELTVAAADEAPLTAAAAAAPPADAAADAAGEVAAATGPWPWRQQQRSHHLRLFKECTSSIANLPLVRHCTAY